MSEEDFEDYSKADGFVGWIGRDPFFRICILAETVLWLVLALIASCFVCVIRRKCLRGASRKYTPAVETTDNHELRESNCTREKNYIQPCWP